MKKILSLILAICLVFSLAACANKAAPSEESKEESISEISQSQSESESKEQEPAPKKPFEGLTWAENKTYTFNENAKVKNVILIIGDGMGVNHLEAARIAKGDRLACDAMPKICEVSTCNVDGETTDSAAAATAMATGVKTLNKRICVDKDGNDIPNLGEFFKGLGMRTGTAVTAVIPHATPAGFFAHNEFRDNYPDIMQDMINIETDVLFGGGEGNLDYNSKTAMEEHGYKHITKAKQFTEVQNGDKVIGLFRYADMAGGVEPDLATMTSEALRLLENDKGFFLMVEASHIDVSASGCDMEGTMKEMSVFDRAVKVALDYAEGHEGTLVLVTADHETGGLILPDNPTVNDLTNDLFTSGGEHTGVNVNIFAAGAGTTDIFKKDVIENTEIFNIITGFFSMP